VPVHGCLPLFAFVWAVLICARVCVHPLSLSLGPWFMHSCLCVYKYLLYVKT
jgi:hypothetical protein